MDENRSFSSLPQPLVKVLISWTMIGLFVVIISVVIAVCTSDIKALSLLVATVYYWSMSYLTFAHWKSGTIRELPVVCASKRELGPVKNNLSVCFSSYDDNVATKEYILSKRTCPYVEGMSYVIYIDDMNPQHILAYMPANLASNNE